MLRETKSCWHVKSSRCFLEMMKRFILPGSESIMDDDLWMANEAGMDE